MSDSWWQIAVSCDSAEADTIAAVLVAATGQGVEEPDNGRLLTAVPTFAEAEEVMVMLRERVSGITIELNELEPADWSVAWRDGIVPRTIGRLVVTPSWHEITPNADQVVVTIDPEMAFGTGEHGSTRAALALMECLPLNGVHIVDLGSGSGILAIAGVLMGAASAIGIEMDQEAMPFAEANAERNGVADRARFLLGDAGELGPIAGPAPVVCSNILRTVNVQLLPAIAATLAPGGVVIFSGMEVPERELFLPVLSENGWQVVDEVTDAGWWAVTARRPA